MSLRELSESPPQQRTQRRSTSSSDVKPNLRRPVVSERRQPHSQQWQQGSLQHVAGAPELAVVDVHYEEEEEEEESVSGDEVRAGVGASVSVSVLVDDEEEDDYAEDDYEDESSLEEYVNVFEDRRGDQ